MRISLIASILLLANIGLFSQIDVNTNFNIISPQPIDTRDTLTNLSDTASVSAGQLFPGLLTYAADVNQWWFWNGTYWERIVTDAISTAAPDTVRFLVYAPSHGLTDTIATYGYVPIHSDYTRANSISLDSTHFAYAVDAPHIDTLELKFSGTITVSGHGLTVGRLYYLQDSGPDGTTPGTVRAPTVYVLDANTLVLTEVGADQDQVISRQAVPSPVFTFWGGDPQNPSDSIMQVVVDSLFKPAGLAKPSTIFFMSYSSQSKNPTYQDDTPTDSPLNPSHSWFYDGNVVTRINHLLTSIDLQATSAGLFTLDTVMLIGGVPTDSTVANWLDSNYVNNNLRLPNGAILYWQGNGTSQSPDYSWMVIDDITNTTETNNFKRIIKRLNNSYIARQELIDSLQKVPRVWLNGQEDFYIPCGSSTVDINLAFSILDDQPVDTAYFSLDFVGTPWTYIEKGVDGFDFYSVEIPGLSVGSYLWDIDVTDVDGNNVYLTSAIDITAQVCGTAGAITGSLSAGKVPVASGSATLIDSDISDNGTIISMGAARTEVNIESQDSVLVDGPVVNIGGQPSATVRVSDTDQKVTVQAGALEQKIEVDDFGVSVQVDGGNYYLPSFQPPVDGDNYVASWLNGTAGWLNLTDSLAAGGGGGSGTVTSVGLSLPSQFAISGSPVTTSGTLTGSWNNQTANTVLAGPTSGGAAAPTFRSLVAADITAGGGVTGSGTTNYLPKWSSSTALGNSLVYDNGTNVGIGTTSPQQVLHVEGNGRFRNSDLRLEFLLPGYGNPTSFGILGEYAARILAGGSSGMLFQAFSNNAGAPGTRFQGHVGGTVPTVPALAFEGFKNDGSTGRSSMTGTETVMGVYTGEYSTGTKLLSVHPNGVVIGAGTPSYILDINGTGGARIPVGTSPAQRPTNALAVLRGSSTDTDIEWGDGITWWKIPKASTSSFTSGSIIHASSANGSLTQNTGLVYTSTAAGRLLTANGRLDLNTLGEEQTTSAASLTDNFFVDIDPDWEPTQDSVVLSLLRLRHRGVNNPGSGGTRRLLLHSEDEAGGGRAIQLFESGLKLNRGSATTLYEKFTLPTAWLEIGETVATDSYIRTYNSEDGTTGSIIHDFRQDYTKLGSYKFNTDQSLSGKGDYTIKYNSSSGEMEVAPSALSTRGRLTETTTNTLTPISGGFIRVAGLSSANLSNFTATDSTLTYTGTESVLMEIRYSGAISMAAVGGGTYQARFKIFVNSTGYDESQSEVQVIPAAADTWKQSISGSTWVTLATNDVVSLKFDGTVSGYTLAVEKLNFTINAL